MFLSLTCFYTTTDTIWIRRHQILITDREASDGMFNDEPVLRRTKGRSGASAENNSAAKEQNKAFLKIYCRLKGQPLLSRYDTDRCDLQTFSWTKDTHTHTHFSTSRWRKPSHTHSCMKHIRTTLHSSQTQTPPADSFLALSVCVCLSLRSH